MANQHHHKPPHRRDDPFLAKYSAAELSTASEFLSNWLPFLTRGLCRPCTASLSERIRSLQPMEANGGKLLKQEGVDSVVSARRNSDANDCDCDSHSLGSWKDDADVNDNYDAKSAGSWKDGENGSFDPVAEMQTEASSSEILGPPPATPVMKMSWADMTQEDEDFEEEEETEVSSRQMENGNGNGAKKEVKAKTELSWEQRDLIRFNNVKRKKNYASFEKINGKFVNILEGLELHEHVFSTVEQNRIVKEVGRLQEMGRKGELRGRTFTAPQKWMKGKGRVTMQFGCCYNYAIDRKGNPPGILPDETVEPIPQLLKSMIRRLVRWHVLPPSCVPDSCIVNVYDVGDCIPPHIDNHDFLRPFCTVSFLSECEILFGSKLEIIGPGEFGGDSRIPLPVGSVLVLNGNGADVAKHCVPAVPTKRISITFRKMDPAKQPIDFEPEPDLQGIKPLVAGADISSSGAARRQSIRRDSRPATEGRRPTRLESLVIEADLSRSRGPGRRQVYRSDERAEIASSEGSGSSQRGPGPRQPRQPYQVRRKGRIDNDS